MTIQTLISLFFVSFLSIPSFSGDLFQNPDTAARVVSVSGIALLSGSGKKQSTLKPGQEIEKNAVINTGSDGKVKLLFADRSIVDIAPSSLFKIENFSKGEDRKVDLEMKYGSIRAAITEKVKKGGRFRVKTPTAIMGVRGTEFYASQPLPPSMSAFSTNPTQVDLKNLPPLEVAVTQGSVALQSDQGNQSPIALNEGQGFTLSHSDTSAGLDRTLSSSAQDSSQNTNNQPGSITPEMTAKFESTKMESGVKVQVVAKVDGSESNSEDSSREPSSQDGEKKDSKSSENVTLKQVKTTLQGSVGANGKNQMGSINKIQSGLPGMESISSENLNQILNNIQNQTQAGSANISVTVQF